MDTRTWERFRAEVLAVVEKHVGQAYFEGTGVGHSEQWGDEDAYTVIAQEPWYSDMREALYNDLANVAQYYGQEAVAVTEGRTAFV
jgi:acetylornithine deacetylase/succinyl-diaminopimelate desuccinylase-like protein